jgi:hypothetical protein
MDKAIATQLANIERRTGKSLDALAKIITSSGLTKHGEIRDMLKKELGTGHTEHPRTSCSSPTRCPAAGAGGRASPMSR